MKHKNYILMFLFLISLLSSLILALQPVPLICEEGCDVVTTSKYAYTLGIKNSIFGIFAFSILSITTYLETRNPSKRKNAIIHLGIIIGSLAAIYLLYLQVFILKSFCKYCLVVDASMILALIIAISFWKK